MVVMEAAGLPSFLRDKHGEIMQLCNDGDVYVKKNKKNMVPFLFFCLSFPLLLGIHQCR